MAAKPIYGVGLDAASRETRAVVCVLEDARLRCLGSGSAPSRGWLRGRIADQKAVSESIVAAVREAEAASGVPAGSAVVGMGGPTVRGANGRGVLELGYVREIEQLDVNRAVERALRVQLLEDRMLLQLFPQDFVVDEHPGHRDPRNMMASVLEANVHLVTASVQEHTALVGAVNQAHMLVEETIFEALAACYACVFPEERREGIAVIDIGAESTQLVVYYGDSMYLAAPLKISGDHFTRDLAQGLCLTFDEAEMVKLEYGCAIVENCAENARVELPSSGWREPRDAPRRLVAQILEARAEEMFHYARLELARVGMEHALLGGVFLTGGGSLLPDILDVAERTLHCQARYGLGVGIRDWPEELNDPRWTVAAGLAMYSAKLKMKDARRREEAGWLARIMK